MWTYTLDGAVGFSQFTTVSGGNKSLIGQKFSPDVKTESSKLAVFVQAVFLHRTTLFAHTALEQWFFARFWNFFNFYQNQPFFKTYSLSMGCSLCTMADFQNCLISRVFGVFQETFCTEKL